MEDFLSTLFETVASEIKKSLSILYPNSCPPISKLELVICLFFDKTSKTLLLR